MQRRQFLAAGGAAVALGVAGCTAGRETTATGRTTADAETGGIYVQRFRETMSMQGTAADGDYQFALLATVPHTFWTVTGKTVTEVERTDEDTVHLMASVWDGQTGTVLPETGLSVEVTRDGEVVSQEVIYPMLSQPMGFHYGGNFTLDGSGTYTATVSVGGTGIERRGAFAGRFSDPGSVEIPLALTESTRADISSTRIEQGGSPGALAPSESLPMPTGVLPPAAELPGTVRGRVRIDDADFVVTTLDDGEYVAVSARTRYNRYVLPAMALEATVERDGAVVFEGRLDRTLGSRLGYHYGTSVDGVRDGDQVTLTVATPPQVGRHEGYERAFLSTGARTLTL
ncbi:fe2+ transport protein [Halapricum sp. CBA1109]|uniref:DUF7350 domain-containing protein n=1 Tax=Halapricum sp. CBA1109 TaxID=2668068 RepID=UPI0013B85EAF|nr:fe2+ transport protein [Halapricum sp. CBA1109]